MITENGKSLPVENIPILCTGFKMAQNLLLHHCLSIRKMERFFLNDFDESTIAKNIFLTGPNVRKGNTIFVIYINFANVLP